jgi:hypothetical protein
MTDSNVETGLDAYIGNRRLRMDLELATATRGRVQLVTSTNVESSHYAYAILSVVMPLFSFS